MLIVTIHILFVFVVSCYHFLFRDLDSLQNNKTGAEIQIQIINFYSPSECHTGPGVDLVSCDLLREGAPIEPVPPVTHWKPDAVVREAALCPQRAVGD